MSVKVPTLRYALWPHTENMEKRLVPLNTEIVWIWQKSHQYHPLIHMKSKNMYSDIQIQNLVKYFKGN